MTLHRDGHGLRTIVPAIDISSCIPVDHVYSNLLPSSMTGLLCRQISFSPPPVSCIALLYSNLLHADIKMWPNIPL
jgi:hypothetical protein